MKNKSSTWDTRIISLILFAIFVFQSGAGSFTVKAHAKEITNSSENVSLNHNVTSNTSMIDVSLLSQDDIPSFISSERVKENNHVLRLNDEETENTIVYLNANGTKTMYIMDFPIKFTSTKGESVFYDLTVRDNGNNYTITSSDIGFLASKDVNKGFTMTHQDFSISLIAAPEFTDNVGISTSLMPTVSATSEYVTYLNIFGEGTSVRYSPMYNGVKEDIILSEYTGISTFNFLMYTEGKYVFQNENGYYIASAESNPLKIDIGNVLAYDANIKLSEGDISIIPIKEGMVYQVTIKIDEAFLKSPQTVYPVIIDPTLTVSDSTHGASAIIDAPVYSGLPTQNFGNYIYNRAGYLDETYKIGRTAVKLNGLVNSAVYPTLSADAIQDVKFYVRDSSGGLQRTIKIFALENITNWTESSITWNTTTGNISTVLQATATLGNNAWSYFDITNLVKCWKNGTYNASCGFIMQGATETADSNFYSSEAATSNWPYIEITYLSQGTGGGNSFANAETTQFGDIKTVHPVIKNEKRYFKFTPTVSGEYMFFSIRESGDPMMWLYNSNYVLIDDDDDSGSASNFRLTAMLTAGNTYYIALGHFDIRAGEYELHILRDAGTANGTYYLKNVGTTYYLDIHGPNAQEKVHQWAYHTGTQLKWKLTRDSNGYYTIQSMYGDQKYVAISSTVVGADNVVLISSVTDYARWKIYRDAENHLYLEPKYAKGTTMYVPNYNQGTEIQLVTTSTNNNNRNKWILSSSANSETHTHVYETTPGSSTTHPHEITMRCDCGATQTSYDIRITCDICMADGGCATNTEMATKVFSGLDSDNDFSIPTIYPTECYVEYTNYFIKPVSTLTNFPKFATYASSIVSYAVPPPNSPSINCISSRQVIYYSESGTVLLTQNMRWDADSNAYPQEPITVYKFNTMPLYTITGASFSMEGLGGSHYVSNTTEFP